jgi:hypothetical protein
MTIFPAFARMIAESFQSSPFVYRVHVSQPAVPLSGPPLCSICQNDFVDTEAQKGFKNWCYDCGSTRR